MRPEDGNARASLPRVRPGAATGMLQADRPNLTGCPSHSTQVPHLYVDEVVDVVQLEQQVLFRLGHVGPPLARLLKPSRSKTPGSLKPMGAQW